MNNRQRKKIKGTILRLANQLSMIELDEVVRKVVTKDNMVIVEIAVTQKGGNKKS